MTNIDKPVFEKTMKQKTALVLISEAIHALLFGGSRSGKTFIITYAIILRALKCKSRHVFLRKHFAHVKQSIWYDTLPKVLDLCFPNLGPALKYDKTDWYITFPNDSELWFGGLDDKDRTEKILGKEYSTMYFNECSEISWRARNIALTRLAEKSKLQNRALYDCNPPKRGHWSYKVFILNEDPETGEKNIDPAKYSSMLLNPYDNTDNIADGYIEDILDKLPPLLRQRFRDGEWVSDETDIFRSEWIITGEQPPDSEFAAKFTFIDPATTEKERATDHSCESAILTVGVTYGGMIYDVEVLHGLWSYGELKNIAKSVYDRHKNTPSYFFSSEDVAAQLWLIEDLNEMGVVCGKMRPDNDKVRRAISITDVLETGKCRINNNFLRNQLLGFPGERLKDLVDAFVYAMKMFKSYGEDHYKRIINKFEGLTNEQKLRKIRKSREFQRYGGQADIEEEWADITEMIDL